MFGEGEWKVRKHGAEKLRVWRKLHLAVDPATNDIVAAEVLLGNVHDTEVLPTLLNPLRRKLGRVYADGAYTAKPAISLSRAKGRQPVSRLERTRDSGKRGPQEMRLCW
ncbi:transposase [Aeromonas veronii]|uniref:transposase n=1 Tax=Aeromonas veronii TaxID=654 RepID=UPI003BA2C0A1